MPLPVVSLTVIGTVIRVPGEADTLGRATVTGGVPVAVAVGDRATVGVNVGVAVFVAVEVLVGVFVAVLVAVAVFVFVAVAVNVGPGVPVLVGVAVFVAVGVGVTHPPPTICPRISPPGKVLECTLK